MAKPTDKPSDAPKDQPTAPDTAADQPTLPADRAKAAPVAPAADGPGVAHDTRAEQSGGQGPRPIKAKTPVTSGGPEAWAIPHTPAARADREAALQHAQDELGRMADRGALPEALQAPTGPPPAAAPAGAAASTRGATASADPWQAVAQAEARVKRLVADLTEEDAGGEAKARVTGAPAPRGAAVQNHSISREEMQANGITDDLLMNAQGLGVPRLVLLDTDNGVKDAVRDYMDAVRRAQG